MKITCVYEPWYRIHFKNLGPGQQARWGDTEFLYNDAADAADLWVVWQSLEGLPRPETVQVPPGNTVLILREPPDILQLPQRYVRQFRWVIAPDTRLRHRNLLLQQFGQVWHIEEDFDTLAALRPPEKTKLISACTSAKVDTEGHRKRLRLIEALKARFGDDLDHYGRGVRPIPLKRDALYPYRYHLALENGSWPHYWTEKLADAYLGYTLPLYWGCPNIGAYFDPESLIQLDPDDLDASVRRVEAAVESDAYAARLPHIEAAREQVLRTYNLYALLSRLLDRLPPAARQPVTLQPQRAFDYSLRFRLRRQYEAFRLRLRPDEPHGGTGTGTAAGPRPTSTARR